jgi:ZIP family zinc transporter
MAELIAKLRNHEAALISVPTVRKVVGWSAVIGGGVILAADLLRSVALALQNSSVLAAGVGASAVAGLATGVGALAVVFLRNFTRRGQDGLMGFAAGVMLAATVFSLLLPSLEAARAAMDSATNAALFVGLALLAGGGVLWLADRFLPHEHFVKPGRAQSEARAKGLWLIVVALALHNVPEGLAVGAGFAGGGQIGLATAIGIGIQNMPEGLVVAAALSMLGRSVLVAIGVATLTGLVEPLGALIGGTLAGLGAALLPATLAFAAGAMLFVISHEMVPESHRSGNEGTATFGLLTGFVSMLVLTSSFI